MSKSRQVSRRQFLQTAGAVAGGVAATALAARAVRGAGGAASRGGAGGGGFSVSMVPHETDPLVASPQGRWAVGHLTQTLKAKGITLDKWPADLTINIQGKTNLQGSEKFTITPGWYPVGPDTNGQGLHVEASDSLGLVYALTELADRVRLSANPRAALTFAQPVTESPANRIRGIFRMFASEVEDKRWFYDREGWQKYLDLLVTSRFNGFNLSFGLSYDFSSGLTDTYTFFMYPFFVNVPGYNVRAIAKGGTPLAAEEMQKNLDTLKFISDECALRGLQFNLGIWTHNYRWTNSPNATHTIDGLNAQTQAPYARDAMKMILQACPGITGITLRTHGESGVPEGSYDLWKIIMSGITGHKNADGSPRIIELDMHGKTMTQEMIDTALGTGMPVTISCKFWAEHMGLPYVQASIREQEMPRANNGTGLMALSSGTRSFLRYGIGDLLTKDRKYKVIHRVWPGTQRLLLWGDPLFAAEYGRAGHFAGMDGIEYFEPLSFKGRAGSSMAIPAAPDRSGYADASLRAEHDWEKYAYTFRLWGRLSYNPEAPAETWQRQLNSEFGSLAGDFETALASASRILPCITTVHDPAAANFNFWPEIYVNMSLFDTTKVGSYGEAPSPKVFGNVTSLDPQMFATVNEYVDALLAGKALAKISPLDIALQLDTWSAATATSFIQFRKLDDFRNSLSPAILRRPFIDASIAAAIGQFFAHKFRAAILWQLFNLSAREPARTAALDSYKKARDAWATIADPKVAAANNAQAYLPDLTFGPDRQLRRHWSDRLADIDADIAGLATRAAQPRNPAPPADAIVKLIEKVLNPAPADAKKLTVKHTPPATFKAGEAIRLWMGPDTPGILHYRHLHQGERYLSLPTEKDDVGQVAVIPAGFTNSPYPIQYYFEIRTQDAAVMYPGFKENFTGTPYFVLMPA